METLDTTAFVAALTAEGGSSGELVKTFEDSQLPGVVNRGAPLELYDSATDRGFGSASRNAARMGSLRAVIDAANRYESAIPQRDCTHDSLSARRSFTLAIRRRCPSGKPLM